MIGPYANLLGHTGCFFCCSALKLTKCQLLKEISELFLPKNDYERKKFTEPKLFPPYNRNRSITFNFFIENLVRVDTLN